VVIEKYLRKLVSKDGSDLYLTVGAPASAKFNGNLQALSDVNLTSETMEEIAYGVMTDEQKRIFKDIPELNIALSIKDIGRFRVNIYKQRENIAMVVRNIKVEIPNIDDLGLPEILKKIIMVKRGLILFIGATGSGKSTSLAALIDYRNRKSKGHIITIEDPIEYIHPHKGCLISQREIGIDTNSYEEALKNTLRQAPDVILIGEIRDRETMEHAIAFAETGHLCLSTLHANNSNQALDRIINFFPEEKTNQILLDLSLNLKAFISQRLIPTKDKKRKAAIEILLGTARAKELIHNNDVHELKDLMVKSKEIGMQSFDMHIYEMYKDGIISLQDALENSDSPNDIQVKVNLDENSKKQNINFELMDEK